MKNFRYNKLISLLSLFCLILISASCTDISQGNQRRKFEFLYKMSNNATMLNEFTGSLAYPEELAMYKTRMEKLYSDAEKMETIKGWDISEVLKKNFLSIIKDNIQSSQKLAEMKLPEKSSLQKESEFILMNERVTGFQDELQTEITNIGKQ